MALLYAVVTLIFLYLGSNIISFYKNYLVAQKSGLPVVISPIYPNNVIWMIISVPLRGTLERILPAIVWDRVKMAIHGWEFLDKGKSQTKYGKSFMYVTPGSNELWTADVEVVSEILARRNDFLQLKLTSVFFGMFGPNIMSSNGAAWERQRRLIGPLLNEKISRGTWDEALAQTESMLDDMIERQAIAATKGNGTVLSDLRVLAFNCLLATNFGVTRPFKKPEETPQRHQVPFSEVMRTISSYLIVAALIPTRIAVSIFMPPTVRMIGNAKSEFILYVKEMLQKKREISEKSDDHNDSDMLSFLIKASDGEKSQKSQQELDKSPGIKRLYLTEAEIMGNLFQFTVAGYETGANTLLYAMALLAIYPEVQAWLFEEISIVLTDIGNPKEPLYEAMYHRLPRCQALMHEVLRLYTPIMHISRTTRGQQTIYIPSSSTNPLSTGRTYLIPDGTTVYTSTSAIHFDPSIWGTDAHEFRPSRWIAKNKNQNGEETETLFVPPKNTFLPWSGGPRLCPGMKSSQVKFVGVMMGILRDWRVVSSMTREVDGSRPNDWNVKKECLEEIRRGMIRIVEDSQPRIVLEMNSPEKLGLQLVKIANS